jgi:hypothetical protein
MPLEVCRCVALLGDGSSIVEKDRRDSTVFDATVAGEWLKWIMS